MGNEYQNMLMHRGVVGMKWGEKNGPPYPLKNNNNYVGNAKDINFCVTFLLSYLGVSAFSVAKAKITSENAKRNPNSKQIGRSELNEEYDSETGLYLKNTNDTLDDDVKKVNPNLKKSKAFQINCTASTVAMELRNRGYDVCAGTDGTKWIVNGGSSIIERRKWYKNNDYMDVETSVASATKPSKEFFNKIRNDTTNGSASGELLMRWKFGLGGHSMFYKTENGKITVYDAQSGEKYSEEQIEKYLGRKIVKNVLYVRLDNKEFDYDYLKKNNIID